MKSAENKSHIKYAKEILAAEAQAILSIAEKLDSSFEQAVNLLLDMSDVGHVIVSGMGKAGFVGRKLSATLASIGIPSFFLNPAEAVHGDLGRYTKSDLALVLSNSGETDEIIRTLPVVKKVGCPVISMTSNVNSTLARYSDIVLDIGSFEEAGPLGLAPTTSTTAMLALGDALAMAAMNSKGFSEEEFAFFHPGGTLGRSLLPVKEIMRKGDENCVVPETMLTRDVLHQITTTKGRPGAAAVVDQEGKLTGVFTDGNFRRLLDQGIEFLSQPVSTVITRNPKTINQDKVAADALSILSKYKIDQVIVVDNENIPVGMVDIQDLIEVRLLKGRQTPLNGDD